MPTPSHRRTATLPRDAGHRDAPPPAKILPSDPDPLADADPAGAPAATDAKQRRGKPAA